MFSKKYIIHSSDHFNPALFPQITDDIVVVRETIKKMPGAFHAEMLLSFAKNHCIKTDWVNSNPEFAALITSKALPINNFEMLFDCSNDNRIFQDEFEQYVKTCLKTGH